MSEIDELIDEDAKTALRARIARLEAAGTELLNEVEIDRNMLLTEPSSGEELARLTIKIRRWQEACE